MPDPGHKGGTPWGRGYPERTTVRPNFASGKMPDPSSGPWPAGCACVSLDWTLRWLQPLGGPRPRSRTANSGAQAALREIKALGARRPCLFARSSHPWRRHAPFQGAPGLCTARLQGLATIPQGSTGRPRRRGTAGAQGDGAPRCGRPGHGMGDPSVFRPVSLAYRRGCRCVVASIRLVWAMPL